MMRATAMPRRPSPTVPNTLPLRHTAGTVCHPPVLTDKSSWAMLRAAPRIMATQCSVVLTDPTPACARSMEPATGMERSRKASRSSARFRLPVVRRSRRLGRRETSSRGNGVRSRMVPGDVSRDQRLGEGMTYR